MFPEWMNPIVVFFNTIFGSIAQVGSSPAADAAVAVGSL